MEARFAGPGSKSAFLAARHYALTTAVLIYSYAIRNRRNSLKTQGRHHV